MLQLLHFGSLKLRSTLSNILNQLLKSQNHEALLSGIETAGIIKHLKIKHLILENLKSNDISIKKQQYWL